MLAAVFLAELVVGSPDLDLPYVTNVVTGVPLTLLLVYSGVWITRSEISPDRYRHVAVWAVVGALFLGGVSAILSFTLFTGFWARVASVRWGIAVGGGTGVIVGGYQARVVEQAVLTERAQRRATALQRQNDRLEEFAGIVAHDIRNPLTVASGHLELAREDDDTPHLETAARALERAERMIERTLTLARSGRAIADREPVDLGDLAERSWASVVTPDADLAVDGTPTVSADPDRLQHLLENLFRNAVDHGGPGVTVCVGPLKDGFYVEDDGPGIPDAERDRILEPGVSTDEDGSGFGLAIVAQIARAHGWEVSVTASQAGGARFEFTGTEEGSGPPTDPWAAETAMPG